MKEIFISRFSPNRTDPQQLEAITVQRDHMIDDAVDKVVTSILTKNKHHMVFFGSRGSGKTHLVSLVYHRVVNRDDLEGKMLIAWLNEDETSPTFLSLLIRIYRALSIKYPQFFEEERLEAIYDLKDPELAVEELGRLLVKLVGKKTVLVLLENLDAVFKDFSDEEQKRWRAFMQNNPQVFCTLATAQRLSNDFSKQDSPFFGFFNSTHLKPFSVDEAKILLRKIAELKEDKDLEDYLVTPKGRSRVRALHHLTGGNQRLFIILSEFANKETLDDLVGPFEELADEQLTPYYQERLRWLSTQQRTIVEFLCKVTKPTSVKEIARQLFTPHGTITGQLKLLREMGYVVANRRGKESLYELAEPLMRLSYQIKETKGKSPLRILVDFLRIWYERDELETLSDEEGGLHGLCLSYVREAIRLVDVEGNLRDELIRNCLPAVFDKEVTDDQLQIYEDLYEESREGRDLLSYLMALVYAGRKPRIFWYIKKNSIGNLETMLLVLGMLDYVVNDFMDLDESFFSFDSPIMTQAACKQIAYAAASSTILKNNQSQEGWLMGIERLEKSLEANLNKWVVVDFHLSNVLLVAASIFDADKAQEEFLKVVDLLDKHGVTRYVASSLLEKEHVVAVVEASGDFLLKIWISLAEQFSELKIGVKILEVVVACLRADKDEKILLDLPMEERKIAKDFIEKNFA